MSRTRSSSMATVGIVIGVLLASVPFALADDAAKAEEVTSKFVVTGMT